MAKKHAEKIEIEHPKWCGQVIPLHDDNRGPEMLSAVFIACALSVLWCLIGFVGARWHYKQPLAAPMPTIQIDRLKVAVLNDDIETAREILGIREVER
jgi:hypothetical protein